MVSPINMNFIFFAFFLLYTIVPFFFALPLEQALCENSYSFSTCTHAGLCKISKLA